MNPKVLVSSAKDELLDLIYRDSRRPCFVNLLEFEQELPNIKLYSFSNSFDLQDSEDRRTDLLTI
jgi:hypothetical protein